MEQLRRAADLMQRQVEYAQSIGCTVVQDSIECTTEQAEKLAAWWDEQTRGLK